MSKYKTLYFNSLTAPSGIAELLNKQFDSGWEFVCCCGDSVFIFKRMDEVEP